MRSSPRDRRGPPATGSQFTTVEQVRRQRSWLRRALRIFTSQESDSSDPDNGLNPLLAFPSETSPQERLAMPELPRRSVIRLRDPEVSPYNWRAVVIAGIVGAVIGLTLVA